MQAPTHCGCTHLVTRILDCTSEAGEVRSKCALYAFCLTTVEMMWPETSSSILNCESLSSLSQQKKETTFKFASVDLKTTTFLQAHMNSSFYYKSCVFFLSLFTLIPVLSLQCPIFQVSLKLNCYFRTAMPKYAHIRYRDFSTDADRILLVHNKNVP